jgi:glutaminyl-tRNA synthetase
MRPLKLVLTNLPEGYEETVEAVQNPEDSGAGIRPVALTRELYIEQEDFMEDPPKKFFRLRPGGEVRLKYAYIVRCDEVIKDDSGRVVALHGTADLGSKTGGPTAGRKVKGTIHWVSASRAVDVEVRLYDRLFTVDEPDAAGGEGGDFKQHLNPASLEIVTAKAEPSLAQADAALRYQFERLGYFTLDAALSSAAGAVRPVFNRTITLKDAWAKQARQPG